MYRNIIFALMFLIALMTTPRPVQAAVLVVDSPLDEVDAVPGDGACLSTPSGVCTLRAAIQEANALAGADTVTLPAGTYTLSIAGTGEDAGSTGDLDILQNLTITGADQATTFIQGGPGPVFTGIDRVFHVIGVRLTMSGVTVRYGSTAGAQSGGGLYNDAGTVNLTAATLIDNRAVNAGGGIIYNRAGSMTLDGVTIGTSNNSTLGGCILNENGSTFTLDNSTVSACGALILGGAVYNINSTFTATNSSITGTAEFDGGGIYHAGGALTLLRSTILNSIALTGNGGGLYSTGGTVNITNSTFTGSQAITNGALHHATGTLDIVNSTFSGNTAFGGSAIFAAGGTTVSIANTIIAGSTAPGGNCAGIPPSPATNLTDDATCPGFTQATPVQINLGALTGTPAYFPLLAGSVAVDTGDDSVCPPNDQRGAGRPRGSGCDIGAYEVVNGAPVARPASTSTPQDTPLVMPPPGVLDSSNDPDGDPLMAMLDTPPANGGILLNTDGSFTYTPTLGFKGVDTFRYYVNDGYTNSTSATVYIGVGVPAPPLPGGGGQEAEDQGAATAPSAITSGPACRLSSPTSGILRTNQPGDAFCSILNENGVYMIDPGGIGIQSVINLGVLQAVDVFGLDSETVSVCLLGTGGTVFLDAANMPRSPEWLPSATHVIDSRTYTCAVIHGAGTVVLVAAQGDTTAAPQPPVEPQTLTDCRVTTTHMVNLREHPGMHGGVITVLPYDLTLEATARAAGWMRVIYEDGQGWVSAAYLQQRGTCD